MNGWLENYRGVVSPWECDVVEHLTIACYFERFGDANLSLMEAVGLGPGYMEKEGRACAAVECYVRFAEELRVGDVLHIDGAILGVDEKVVRMGHKVVNSATGAVAATMEQKLVHFDLERRKSVPFSPERREALQAGAVVWDGPAREERPVPDGLEGFVDGVRDGAKPWEIDVLGHLAFQYYVHRFSAASAHAMTSFGMTPAYAREERRGLSTFELDLRFLRELHAGDLITVKTALMHVGNTSFRLFHKMFNVRTGALSATMSQFGVHLDLDARRPAPLPEALREKAKAMLVLSFENE